jgi:hypothetical protein
VRVIHLLAAGAAAAALALGAVPAAHAAPPGSVIVQPGTVAPGGQVSVFAPSCDAPTGTASSSAFAATIPLAMLHTMTGGVGFIGKTARPGTWRVYVTCGRQHFTGWVSVCHCGHPSPSPSPSASPSKSATPSASPSASSSKSAAPKPTPTHARPHGGAATGDGATQDAAASSGAGSLGTGALLLAGGLGLGAVAVRRRRGRARQD